VLPFLPVDVGDRTTKNKKNSNKNIAKKCKKIVDKQKSIIYNKGTNKQDHKKFNLLVMEVQNEKSTIKCYKL
jgi:hypothetical protein